MARMEVRDAVLEVREFGSGEPVVLIHGSVSDYRTWSHLLSGFGPRYRVITYSRRYHWPNDPIPTDADYSMIEQLHDLESLLRVMGLDPVHLVGHSYGAYLALLLAMRRPADVQTLVLAEPPVVPLFIGAPPGPSDLFKVLVTRPRTGICLVRFIVQGVLPATLAVRRGDSETALTRFGASTLGRETFEAISEERLEQARANFIDAEFLGSGLAPLSQTDVAGVSRPTLLLGGDRSPPLFEHLLDRLEELIPNTRRAVIPDASHIMHEDNPTVFLDLVRSFIDSQAVA